MMRTLLRYAALIVTAIIAVACILRAGARLSPGTAVLSATPSKDMLSAFIDSLHGPMSQLLLQILLIVVVARIGGTIVSWFGQAAVIGEMFAGIALGPSLLGAFAPGVSRFLFPAQSLPALLMLSQVGVLLFMFIVGMELDTRLLLERARSAVLVSHASIVAPFLLGCSAALWLYRGYAGAGASFLTFALFLGISMSVTAFPVLARILRERGLTSTPLGTSAIACAAVDDVSAWCGLAFIVALARSQTLPRALLTLGLSVAFVFAMLRGVKPLLARLLESDPDPDHPRRNATVTALATVLGAALCTEAIGIHAIFGAFLAGVVMPSHRGFRHYLQEHLEEFSTLFLLPIFFVYTGLRTQIGLLGTGGDWLVCGVLLVIATVGKFGGSTLAARITGLPWGESIALGALMNTRGLVELIVLNLGLDLGVLSSKIFAMLVIMAITTTCAASPVLTLLQRVSARAVTADGA